MDTDTTNKKCTTAGNLWLLPHDHLDFQIAYAANAGADAAGGHLWHRAGGLCHPAAWS